MMFRRIYWVTEEMCSNGCGRVTGVYTSIQDLTSKGLRWIGDAPKGFRISLVQLDQEGDVLGCWSAPDFGNLTQDLMPYVETQEFNLDDVNQLQGTLQSFCGVHA